ncbi:MAG: U32 family peptidase, partial [Acutalibacteraceae bacterium]
KAQEKKIPAFVARFEKSSQIPDDLSGISAVMLPIEENPDIKIDENIIKIADIPRGIVSEDLIEKRLKLFARHGFRVAACGNLAAVEIAKNAGFSVLADTGFNITNPESVITAEKMGVTGVVLSTELTINDAKFCCSIPKGIIAYGKIPLMIFKNCPIKNGISCENCDKNGIITDRLGVEFNVRCRMGYSEMLNSVPVWLADRKEELSGLDFLVLYFTTESKQRALEVIEMYKAGAAPDVKHTRGLYYRGMI